MKRVILLLFISSFLISQSLTKGWYNDSFEVPDVLWTDELEVLGGTPGVGKVLTDDGTGTGIAIWTTPTGGFADPMTTRGDIIYRNPSNITARLGLGANNFVLGSDGTDLSWTDISGVYQPLHASLTSISGLTYVSGSFIKLNSANTYVVRTFAEVLSDLSGMASGAFSFNDQNVEDVGQLSVDLIKSNDGIVIVVTDSTNFSDDVNIGGSLGVGTAKPISPFELQAGLTTTGAVFSLGTKEPTVAGSDKLGQINFYAPLEADEADARLVGASIWAEAEAEFTATENYTHLVFATATSGVATAKMRIFGNGNVAIGFAEALSKLSIDGGLHVGGTNDAGDNNLLVDGTVIIGLDARHPMLGYATGVNVDRSIALEIAVGGTPNTNINISDASDVAGLGWNYPSISDATNLAKSGDVGSFTLDATGQILTLDLAETVIGIKSAAWRGKHIINSASDELYELSITVDSGNIRISVWKHAGANPVDWTSIMDAGDVVRLRIAFATID